MTEIPEKMLTYYLPGSTSSLVNRHAKQTKNMRLLLDKFVPANVIDQELFEDKSERGRWLQALVRDNQPDEGLAKASYQRWLNLTAACAAHTTQGTIDWRMVVGLGGNNILEIDITLHHLYGTPIIPGSALKGLTRAYAATKPEFRVPAKGKARNGQDIKQDTMISPDDTQDHPELKEIFGHAGEGSSSGSAGTVIFFDAVPVDGAARLEVDIMNPHYPKYYQSLGASDPKKPTNDQNPIPVMFLTVPESTFAFAVAPRNPHDKTHQAHAKKVIKWLEQALNDQGAGGKTSAGYGYFRDFKEIEKPKPPEIIRSNVKSPNIGQTITCTAIENTSDLLRQLRETETTQLFRYMEHNIRDVIIVLKQEDSAERSWPPKQSANLQVLRTEQIGARLVIYCKATPKKDKEKKKK